MELHQQTLFHHGIRVIDLAQHETIKPREIHSACSLIEPRIVSTSVGVARAGDTKHFMRMNDFPTVFRQAQRSTFQNAVKTHGDLRREQVRFIDEKKPAIAHCKAQWAIFITHAPIMQRDVTAQVCKLQSCMTCHLKNRVVQTGGKLLDKARFSRTRRAIEVKRIKFVHEPDGGISCRFMKAVMWVNGGGIQARILESPNLVSGRHAAEDKPGIHFDGHEGFQFLNGL